MSCRPTGATLTSTSQQTSDVHSLWYRLIPIFAIYLNKEKVNYFLQWNMNSQTLKVEKILGVVGSMFEFACK